MTPNTTSYTPLPRSRGAPARTLVRRTAYVIIHSFERGIGLCGSQAFTSESQIV